MGKCSVPNARQKQILMEMGISADGYSVDHETDGYIIFLHHPTRNRLSIDKGERLRRQEKEEGLTWS